LGESTISLVDVGGIQVNEGAIGYGMIAEFILYVNILTWPVTSLGWITSIVQRAAASQTQINEFLDQKNDIISTENLIKKIEGKISIQNVSFLYPESGTQALDNINFEV